MRSLKMILAVAVAVAGAPGCGTPPSRLNAPPQGYTESPADGQEIFTYMVDNATLADMSLADIHFVPHTSEINSSGLRRLDRYVSLLKIYGGTLRYDTRLSDEDLITGRLKNVKEFLTLAGVDPQRLDVRPDLPGGTGLLAEEASIIRKKSMAQPEKKKSGGLLESLLSAMQPGAR